MPRVGFQKIIPEFRAGLIESWRGTTRIISQVDGAGPSNAHVSPATVAWTRTSATSFLHGFEEDPDHSIESASEFFLRHGAPETDRILGLRVGSAVATFDDYYNLAFVARRSGARFLLLGGRHEEESALHQLGLVRRLHESKAVGPGLVPIPTLEMSHPDFVRHLNELAAARGRRRLMLKFSGWSDPNLVEKLVAVRAVARLGRHRIDAMQVRHEGPNNVQGMPLLNCFGINACMAYISQVGGGTGSSVNQADNWLWSGPDGLTYRRQEDGAPPRPLVSWVDSTFRLQNDADVESETHMLEIRRQHEVAAGSLIGNHIAALAYAGNVADGLKRDLTRLWDALPREFARALEGPAPRRLPGAA